MYDFICVSFNTSCPIKDVDDIKWEKFIRNAIQTLGLGIVNFIAFLQNALIL